jgi:hypothetical protein
MEELPTGGMNAGVGRELVLTRAGYYEMRFCPYAVLF